MTFEEAQAIVSRITYKPNHKFQVADSFPGNWQLFFSGYLPSATDPMGCVMVQIATVEHLEIEFFETLTEKDLLKMCHSLIQRFEHHEIDEWFRVDGQYYRDPHPKG